MDASPMRLPPNVGSGSANLGMLPPTRAVCGVPTEAKARTVLKRNPLVGSSCHRMSAPAPTAVPSFKNVRRVVISPPPMAWDTTPSFTCSMLQPMRCLPEIEGNFIGNSEDLSSNPTGEDRDQISCCVLKENP